jgi:hypothetical protein
MNSWTGNPSEVPCQKHSFTDSEIFMDWMKQTLLPEGKRRRGFRCRSAPHTVHLFQAQAVVEPYSASVEERGTDEGTVDLDTEGYAMECIEVASKRQNEGEANKHPESHVCPVYLSRMDP